MRTCQLPLIPVAQPTWLPESWEEARENLLRVTLEDGRESHLVSVQLLGKHLPRFVLGGRIALGYL